MHSLTLFQCVQSTYGRVIVILAVVSKTRKITSNILTYANLIQTIAKNGNPINLEIEIENEVESTVLNYHESAKNSRLSNKSNNNKNQK